MTIDTGKTILKELQKQHRPGEKRPRLLEFYQRLVEAQLTAGKNLKVPPVHLTEADATGRINEGIPLLDFGGLGLDWTAVLEAFHRVAGVFTAFPELLDDNRDKLDDTAPDLPRLRQAVEAWYSGQPVPPGLYGDISQPLAAAIIQSAMYPFLSARAEKLKKLVHQEYWRREYCPACGGAPDLAYLEKEVGARWVLCSRCDFEWVFPRLECPYCRNNDQQTLAFFSSEDGRYRLHVCDKCRHYLKTIDMRHSDDSIPLPLERLYTLDLDLQAKELGYTAYQPAIMG